MNVSIDVTTNEIPHHPKVSFQPLLKMGLGFVIPIEPPSNQHNYILGYTYYLNNWLSSKCFQMQNNTSYLSFYKNLSSPNLVFHGS